MIGSIYVNSEINKRKTSGNSEIKKVEYGSDLNLY